MNRSVLRRVGWPSLGALLLSLVLASQTMAATWGAPVALGQTSDLVHSVDLVALGSSTVVAVYAEVDGFNPSESDVLARRSTDSGASWGSPIRITGKGRWPAISGRGSNVDVVWVAPNGRVRYARSTNSGKSFGASVALSPSGRSASDPSVARGPDGRVAVAWEEYLDELSGQVTVKVRASKNGGGSFGPAKVMTAVGSQGSDVAIGKGVIYVAYHVGFDKLRVKRSLDSGTTWSSAAKVTDRSWSDGVSMTAVGRHAYVAYTTSRSGSNFFRARYRRTTNSGATWSSQMDLAPATWETHAPDISLKGGVVRAVFNRCDNNWDYCDSDRVMYRESSNGTSWTTAQRVSPKSVETWGPRVGFAGRIVVAYTGYGSGHTNAYVRNGAP
jgi:hypothetical protein